MADFGCFGPNYQESDEDYGWTLFEPSSDSKIIYVSSSEGNNDNDGLSPQAPVKTLAQGYFLLRDGFPDWLLLKRGDIWDQEWLFLDGKSGRSANEKLLFASYGNLFSRPLIKNKGVEQSSSFASDHIAFLDLDFYASCRDPNSPDFDSCSSSEIGFVWGWGEDILVEGCKFHWFHKPVRFVDTDDMNAERHISDITLRRSIIARGYSSSTVAHSSGLYIQYTDNVLLEENIFDHNGWLEGDQNSRTQFNHSNYLKHINNLTIRNSIYSRGSNEAHKIDAKTRLSDGTIIGGVSNTVVEGNFYVQHWNGIDLGDNGPEEDIFSHSNAIVRNNVVTESYSNGIVSTTSLKDALIENNYIVHSGLFETTGGGRRAIGLEGDFLRENITIRNNIAYQEFSDSSSNHDIFRISGKENSQDILVSNNIIQSPIEYRYLIGHVFGASGFNPTTYANNTYFGVGNQNDLFFVISGGGIDKFSFSEWVLASGETGATYEEVQFLNPSRDIRTYNVEVLGGEPTLNDFMWEAYEQSKFNWREAYTAERVNDYIREGFTLSP